MANKRKTLLVEPRFQVPLMLRLAAWVTLASALTAGVMLMVLALSDAGSSGDFFFITPEPGSHPRLLSRLQLLWPAIAGSLLVNLLLSLAFALFYSQRLAGPIHRLTQDLLKIGRGEPVQLSFQLRESDEFQEVAHAFDAMLKRLGEQGFLRRP